MTMLRLLALAVSAALAGPAAAQTPQRPANPLENADRAQLVDCLRRSGGPAATSCIGLVAVSCVRAAASDRGAAEVGCARREEALWRDRLNLASQIILRGLDEGQRARFASLTLAWEGYVAQKCAFYAAQQADALQSGRQAGCELREVGYRALELERALPRPQSRAPAQRPQLFR